MGYSILTPFRTQLDRALMLRFLDREYRPLHIIAKEVGVRLDKNNLRYSSLSLKDVPPASDYEYTLGFYYEEDDDNAEKSYLFTLCYWMALKSGMRRNFRKHSRKLFVIYDGVEEWIVSDDHSFTPDDSWFITVDECGYRKSPYISQLESKHRLIPEYEEEIKTALQIDRAIQLEMQRLNSIWG